MIGIVADREPDGDASAKKISPPYRGAVIDEDGWSVSFAHEDDGRMLGIVVMAELPDVGETVQIPLLLPPDPAARDAVKELIESGEIPAAFAYDVITVEADESSGTASVTVRQVEGGIRQVGI